MKEVIPRDSRKSAYTSLLPLVESMVFNEKDTLPNLANVTALLKTTFNYFWVGFYIVKDGELVLGPFQGTTACARIAYGKGVCGTAWKEKKTQIVADVHLFPGHIACDCNSESEIVVPVFNPDGEVVAVLDIDNDRLDDFDDTDALYLEKMMHIIGVNWMWK